MPQQFVAAELMKEGHESEEAREESECRAYGVPTRIHWRIEPVITDALMSDDAQVVESATEQLYRVRKLSNSKHATFVTIIHLQKLEYAAFNSYDTRPDHLPRPILIDMPLRRNGVTDKLVDVLERWLLYSANSHIKVILVFDAPVRMSFVYSDP